MPQRPPSVQVGHLEFAFERGEVPVGRPLRDAEPDPDVLGAHPVGIVLEQIGDARQARDAIALRSRLEIVVGPGHVASSPGAYPPPAASGSGTPAQVPARPGLSSHRRATTPHRP